MVDATGAPLIGATVMIPGTTTGTSTDLDGNFTIKVGDAKEIQVSYIGYQTMKVAINGQTELKIVMQEDSSVLDEVVVVGYGVQKKATMTGAVSVVGEKQLQDKGSLASPVQAMQGQVPGVIITRSNSAPGEEGWNMKIRGSVSKNASDPLVIIDGVEYEGVGALNQINPNDIATMNILKDAAASIYGSKAAGGVVLITTKKGSADRVRVDYNGSFTAKFIGNQPSSMRIVDWANAQIEAYRNDGYDDSYNRIQWCKMMIEYKDQYFDFDHVKNPIDMFSDTADLTFFDTNWNDILWGNSWSTSHDLAVSGGSEKASYRVSAAYMYDDSNLKWGKNNNNRFNLRLNNTFKFHERFSLTSSIAVNRQDQVSPTLIGQALTSSTAQPGFPSSTKDGKPYGWGTWTSPNWAAELGGENKYKAVSVNVSEAFKYDIINGLSLNATFGYNYRVATPTKLISRTNGNAECPNNATTFGRDCAAIYQLALRYVLQDDATAAARAVADIKAWVENCDGIHHNGDTNQQLILFQVYQFANGMELLRDFNGYGQSDDFRKACDWLVEKFYPTATDFLKRHNNTTDHYWLNWDLASMTSILAMGILTEDQDKINEAILYFKNGIGSGNYQKAANFVYDDPDGTGINIAQCNESGRDQGHATLCMSLMAAFCQMAYNIGEDLFAFDNHRMVAMAEYTAKFNCPKKGIIPTSTDDGSFAHSITSLPYTSYIWCPDSDNKTGERTTLASDKRGTRRPGWEIWRAYGKKTGFKTVYVDEFADYLFPDEGAGIYDRNTGGFDQTGCSSLMFYRE